MKWFPWDTSRWRRVITHLSKPTESRELQNLENSLVVQGLGLGASTAGDTGVIPGQGSKVPWVAWHNRKIKQKKPTIYNTKSELKGKLQNLGDDASMQVHQWYHVSHSEGGGGGMLLVGEVGHGGGKRTEVIQGSASHSALLWTWNCFKKIKSTLKLLNYVWGCPCIHIPFSFFFFFLTW